MSTQKYTPDEALPIQKDEWQWENVLQYLTDQYDNPADLPSEMTDQQFFQWLGEWTCSFSQAEQYQQWFEQMTYDFRNRYSTNIIGEDNQTDSVTLVVYNPDNLEEENYSLTLPENEVDDL